MFINCAFGNRDVNRRTYLAVLGSTAVAGCAGLGDDGTDDESPTGTDTDTDADAGSPTSTATDSPSETGTETDSSTSAEESLSQEAGAESAGSIEVAELAALSDVSWDPEMETAAGTGAVVGTAENVSGDVLGRLRNRLTLFDDGDDVVATTSESLEFMKAGSTYQFALPFTGSDPSSVARFRLDARAWSDAVGNPNDGQVSVSDDEFVELDDGSYAARGTVTNETDEEIFRVLPHVNFYDGSELVAYGDDAITGLGAGESAEWQVPFTGESPDAVGEHQVVVLLE